MITGANGTIGADLVNFFSRNNKIYAFYRTPNSASKNLKNKNIIWVKQDLKKKILYKINPKVIIHCVVVHPFSKKNTYLDYLDSNVIALKNVVEFAWSLPQKFKINTGKTKWILRQILYKYVPKNLIERPKVGFGVPIDQWLRGSLKDWAEDLLNENLMKSEGFFNTKEIRNKWSEHLNGKRNWHNHLWDVLMFQSWLRK